MATAVERRTGTRLRRRLLFPTPWALAMALFVCVAAPVTLVTLQIDANAKFSPIDEPAHLDYVDRAASAEIPRQGEHLLDSTLRELACRGLALGDTNLPPCAAPTLRPEQFPGEGSQYEAHHPPGYYVATVPLRWLTRDLLGIDDKVDATRATGALWLIAGLLLAWAAGRVMGIDPLPLGAALLLLASAPTVIYQSSIVTNDATAVFAGGSVGLAGALAFRHDGPGSPPTQPGGWGQPTIHPGGDRRLC